MIFSGAKLSINSTPRHPKLLGDIIRAQQSVIVVAYHGLSFAFLKADLYLCGLTKEFTL